MRIFVAGATGVLGSRIVPLLVERGHTVAGMTRSAGNGPRLRDLGAQPVICNVFDGDALTEAVRGFGPDLILHELTDLPDNAAELPASQAANARIRVEGTRNLIAAAQAGGCHRLISQSIAWPAPPGVGADALAELERATIDFGGVVLRYGQLYGPGTYYPDTVPGQPRVHVDEAARRTVAGLDAETGIVTIAAD